MRDELFQAHAARGKLLGSTEELALVMGTQVSSWADQLNYSPGTGPGH